MATLSVIIVNFNTRELIRRCLETIFHDGGNVDLEVIVVDNGSTDGSAGMIRQEFPSVKMLSNRENLGFAAGNNRGIQAASGRYILLLNSDTEILDGALEKAVAFMERTPLAGIAGCRLLNRDGTLQPSCRSFPSIGNLFSEAFFLYRAFPRSAFFGKYYMSFFDYKSTREVDVVMGAFMMIRKEVFDDVGMLDASYFMYTEETEFCLRARRRGHRAYFTPDARVIHLGGGAVRDEDRYIRQVHESQFQFLRSSFHGLRKPIALMLKAVGIALRVIVYSVQGFVTREPNLIAKSRTYWRVLRAFMFPGESVYATRNAAA